ncbi:DUF3540 domain-containing protein [Sorangium sp. So ce1078]|uniref:DUF3540 domain-containing protein n=1 Tax=Sorangium sp. So ce1078 TaxID=3133329 RepID=UPI003F5EF704
MSEGAVVRERAASVRAEEYLGPAHVLEAHGQTVVIELPEGESAEAAIALAIPYAAAVGDVLLVIGRGGRFYVIGVLHGTGKTVLELQGDVDVRAAGGALRLSGDRGVELRGPEVDLYGDKVRVFAGALVQKAASLVQRVTGLFSLHARESHTVVDESATTKARRATVLTEETMTINGKEIHLG